MKDILFIILAIAFIISTSLSFIISIALGIKIVQNLLTYDLKVIIMLFIATSLISMITFLNLNDLANSKQV